MSATAGERRCPLCGAAVPVGTACRSGCPLGAGCGTLCCPSCGYRFVAETPLTRWLRRVLERRGDG